ncbi:hypothetical protein SAMN05421835_11543 [Amycolatopsis sacchari]|uniref:Uncharacterized protein n=1 Tax=Amycolatopsis sacchari TaxID=115433 RepID=A0A1I3XDS3_9PSEU|nr:hypothetical protein SAMN05421835_11543 [Amycolatopsis sacchari]
MKRLGSGRWLRPGRGLFGAGLPGIPLVCAAATRPAGPSSLGSLLPRLVLLVAGPSPVSSPLPRPAPLPLAIGLAE